MTTRRSAVTIDLGVVLVTVPLSAFSAASQRVLAAILAARCSNARRKP